MRHEKGLFLIGIRLYLPLYGARVQIAILRVTAQLITYADGRTRAAGCHANRLEEYCTPHHMLLRTSLVGTAANDQFCR